MEGHQGQNTAEDCVTANDLKPVEDHVKANNLKLVENMVPLGYTTRGSGHNQLATREEIAYMDNQLFHDETTTYMDNQLFHRVVAPILATGSAFIGISTLGNDSDSNFVGKLNDIRDKEGNHLFPVINIELVCARCETIHGKELSCQHMMDWHDEKRHGDIELVCELDKFSANT